MTLIEESDELLFIITPYAKIQKWYKLKNKLTEAVEKEIDLKIYIRENEIQTRSEFIEVGITPIEIPLDYP